MGHLSTVEAQIPALMVESILYGIYLITFFVCLQRLFWDSDWKPLRSVNVPMILIILLLFIFSSTSLSLTLIYGMQLLVYGSEVGEIFGSGQPGQAWLNFMKSATLSLQIITADGVLVYRCWVTWNKSFLIVFMPIICWLGSLACAIGILYFRMAMQLGSHMHASAISSISTPFWCFTILANIPSSGLILWRIWKIERAWSPPSVCSTRDIPQRGRLRFARRSLIESGVLYTSATVIAFLVHLWGDGAVHITNAAEVQITGIAFNLIIMRAAGPYPGRVDSAPVISFVSSERMEPRRTVDVAVMTTEDHSSPCNHSIALPHRY